MKLMDKTIQGFLAELKSDSPAPGGGSAAALAGAIGGALGIMVGNLTIGSGKYAEVHEQAKQLVNELEEKLARLEGYVDEDTQAFTQVMQAYKLPKNTDKEKTLRSQTIQQAMKSAAQLPMQVATICMEVLELSGKMLEIGNVNAASDAAVAGRMAHAAMWSAIYNVKINLGSIKDQEFVATMTKQVASVVDRSEKLLLQLVQKAEEKI
jgi:formiminotetrahydrofolate cyclodeaminase